MKKYLPDFILITAFLVVGSAIWYNSDGTASISPTSYAIEEFEEPSVEYKYGYDIAKHHFEDYAIKRNSFMGDILMDHGVDFDDIIKLEKRAEDVFSLRKIAAGKHITFVKDDLCGSPKSFVYRPNRLDFVKFEFRDSIEVTRHRLPTERCIETVAGVIEPQMSISHAMSSLGLDLELIDKMEDALAQVNFHQSQAGDRFKLVYENIYVDGKPVDSGKILSAAYKSGEQEHFGFYYQNDKYSGYYDFDGAPNKRTFLNAPVRASRISSAYSANRFHPVLKRNKPHLGTDYAAPRGTPIMAVANGVVTHRSYTKGNGNYVKIKHDQVYQTQYLHMSRFADGVRPGTYVSQGQTIGYVGSTGLATGPHVCFRFWKNGRQVDHRRENFPPLNPMEATELPNFYVTRDQGVADLSTVAYPNQTLIYASLGE